MARGRRDAAARELGGTATTPRVAASLAAVFALTLLTAAAVEHAAHLRAGAGETTNATPGGWPQSYAVFRLLPAWRDVGRVRTPRDAWSLVPTLRQISDYEDSLEDASLLTAAILPRAQTALTGLLGAGNEQVYIGRAGDLFYRQDVDYVTGPGFLTPAKLAARASSGPAWEDPPSPDPRPAIRGLHTALAERGIRLLVAPIPVKAVVQNGALARGRSADAVMQNPSYATFVQDLRGDGIDVYDPTADVRSVERRYLRTDSHWTPSAMAAAAAGIARQITARRTGGAPTPTVYRQRATRVANTGDVAAMLSLSAGSPLVAPEETEVHEVVRASGDTWAPDPTARVLLLGDSFTNIYSLGTMGWGSSAGLAEHLSYTLQEPVDSIALNAGGARAAREALAQALARGEDRLAGKAVVVYTFAARELASGDWRVFDLPPPSKGRVHDTLAESIVDATIAAKSAPPTPGSVPYPDCIIAFHATDIRPAGAATLPGEAVVFLWGMRDNKWTPASGAAVGSSVRLRLTPWADVERTYGGHSRRELDDEATWLLDVYWGEIVP
jgi:hypothetical protein